MGGIPGKHISRSKVRRRRSHLALKKVQISVCTNCRGPILSHKACIQCGIYNKKK